jgi:DTW domain-containing protein YfiP
VARRSRVPDLTKRCRRCLFLPEVCLCPEIAPIEARTRFVLLRHASERNRPTNTARWAALALGCELVDYGAPGEPVDVARVCEPGTWVLFPGPGAPPDADPPRRVLVLDGSWSQARRMLQRVPALRELPRLALAAPPAAPPGAAGLPRLRRPRIDAGMSTIEAIARALAQLGEPEAGARLDALHAAALARAWSLRGHPLATA